MATDEQRMNTDKKKQRNLRSFLVFGLSVFIRVHPWLNFLTSTPPERSGRLADRGWFRRPATVPTSLWLRRRGPGSRGRSRNARWPYGGAATVPAPAASAAAAGFRGRRLRERTLAGIHQALEHRLGLVGLAELLKAQRLVVGLSAAASRRQTFRRHAVPRMAPGPTPCSRTQWPWHGRPNLRRPARSGSPPRRCERRLRQIRARAGCRAP